MTRHSRLHAVVRHFGLATIVAASLLIAGGSSAMAQETNVAAMRTQHQTVTVQGLDIFYREAVIGLLR